MVFIYSHSVEPDPWESTESRREFFESYAKENGFDPHYHENWYSQSRSKIIARKVSTTLLSLLLFILFHFNNKNVTGVKGSDGISRKQGHTSAV